MKKYWKFYRILVVVYIVITVSVLLYTLAHLLIYGPVVLPDWTGRTVIAPLIGLTVMGLPFIVQKFKTIVQEIKEFIHYKY